MFRLKEMELAMKGRSNENVLGKLCETLTEFNTVAFHVSHIDILLEKVIASTCHAV
jgi:hypothetical protein